MCLTGRFVQRGLFTSIEGYAYFARLSIGTINPAQSIFAHIRSLIYGSEMELTWIIS